MRRITSTELQQNLSAYRQIAKTEPVIITERGEESVAMIPIAMLHRMSALKPGLPSRPMSDYDRFFKLIIPFLEPSKVPTFTHNVKDVYGFAERLMTFTQLDEERFELAGHVFRVRDGVAEVETTCDWILNPTGPMENAKTVWRGRMAIRSIVRKSGVRIWEENPTPESVATLDFVPALIGLVGDGPEVSDWVAQMIFSTMTWERDMDQLFKLTRKEAAALLRDNVAKLRAAFPDLDRDAFVATFGAPA